MTIANIDDQNRQERAADMAAVRFQQRTGLKAIPVFDEVHIVVDPDVADRLSEFLYSERWPVSGGDAA